MPEFVTSLLFLIIVAIFATFLMIAIAKARGKVVDLYISYFHYSNLARNGERN